MKKKFKAFEKIETLPNRSVVMVYGELWEDGYVNGVAVFPCKFSRDGRQVMEYDFSNSTSLHLSKPYSRTKYFNMGWAICAREDKFDHDKGVEICKRRFHDEPLTTQSGTFLTPDMITAIIANEVEYIKKHWEKYVPSLPTMDMIAESKRKVHEADYILDFTGDEGEPQPLNVQKTEPEEEKEFELEFDEESEEDLPGDDINEAPAEEKEDDCPSKDLPPDYPEEKPEEKERKLKEGELVFLSTISNKLSKNKKLALVQDIDEGNGQVSVAFIYEYTEDFSITSFLYGFPFYEKVDRSSIIGIASPEEAEKALKVLKEKEGVTVKDGKLVWFS